MGVEAEGRDRVKSQAWWGGGWGVGGALALPPFRPWSLSSPQSFTVFVPLPLTFCPTSALCCPFIPKVTNHSSLLCPGWPSSQHHWHSLGAFLSLEMAAGSGCGK